jgi:hypothetical protein
MIRFVDILGRYEALEFNQIEAAELLGASERTFRRWCAGYQGWRGGVAEPAAGGGGGSAFGRARRLRFWKFGCVAYRSLKATSNELNTGLNMYRMIDFEPV